MKQNKSKDGDVQLINDGSADPVERSGAILRLAVDGYAEMEPLLVKLLQHENYLLRSRAIGVLLGGWGEEKYLEQGIKLLHNDIDDAVRSEAAFALGSFALRHNDGQKQKERILRELVMQLNQDDDWSVHQACYREILKIIRNKEFGIDLPARFRRERDVDWELLKPYLENSTLQI